MKNSEAILCRDAGVKWIAFTVANDGLSIVVNKAEHVGRLPHDRRAEEDLEHGLEGRQLEATSARASRTCR